jgi:ferredoxin
MRRISAGDELDDDELLGSLRCLKCGQCAEVCARSLELLAAWEELEGKVRERVDDARFREIIQHFAAQVDDNRDELVLPVALP